MFRVYLPGGRNTLLPRHQNTKGSPKMTAPEFQPPSYRPPGARVCVCVCFYLKIIQVFSNTAICGRET